MSIIAIGIDLAKSVFAVHGVNEDGKAELVAFGAVLHGRKYRHRRSLHGRLRTVTKRLAGVV